MFAPPAQGKEKKRAEGKSARDDSAFEGEDPAAFNSLWQTLALRPPAIQPKLTVSQPGDPYEQEADRIAERVLRGATLPRPSDSKPSPPSGATPEAQPKSAPPRKGAGPRRRGERFNSDSVIPPPLIAPQTPTSHGQPLDQATRSFMEPHFGYDFSRVQVHADGEAAEAARAVRARAYTVGGNIVFGAGEYAPSTNEGKRLLAHELAHVVQQLVASTRGAPAVQRPEAERRSVRSQLGTPGSLHIQRQAAPDPVVTLRDAAVAQVQAAIRARLGSFVPATAPQLQPAYRSQVHLVNAQALRDIDIAEAERGLGMNVDSAQAAERRRRIEQRHRGGVGGVTFHSGPRAGHYVRLDRPQAQPDPRLLVDTAHEILHSFGHFPSAFEGIEDALCQFLALYVVYGRITSELAQRHQVYVGAVEALLALVANAPGIDFDFLAASYFRRDLSQLSQQVDSYYGVSTFSLANVGFNGGINEPVQWREVRELFQRRRRIEEVQPGVGRTTEQISRHDPTELHRFDRVPAEEVVRHPERNEYAAWIEAFQSLPRFTPDDRTPQNLDRVSALRSGSFDVLGEPGRREAQPGEEHLAQPDLASPPRVGERLGDQLVDHPSIGFLRRHLPNELIETVYALPSDCADVAIILRHVWLVAHRREERIRVGGRTVTIGSVTGRVNAEHLRQTVMPLFSSANASALIRHPHRNLTWASLQTSLRPGDLLVWRHANGGGHVQTVMNLHRDESRRVDRVELLAGNQPLPPGAGSALRYTPGRRIEIQYLEGADLADRGGRWTWQDGTRLEAAGAP